MIRLVDKFGIVYLVNPSKIAWVSGRPDRPPTIMRLSSAEKDMRLILPLCIGEVEAEISKFFAGGANVVKRSDDSPADQGCEGENHENSGPSPHPQDGNRVSGGVHGDIRHGSQNQA